MTTQLTAAHRELLAQFLPLYMEPDHDPRHNGYIFSDGKRFGRVSAFGETIEVDTLLAEAVCITVNEADALRAEVRRLETALRLACDDVVSDFQDPGGRRAEVRARDYLEAADKGLDYQGLIDLRESQEDSDNG